MRKDKGGRGGRGADLAQGEKDKLGAGKKLSA